MITSANLNSIPFLSSTDSTRAGMSSKQIQQSLTCLNTEIPYVISEDYQYLTNNSNLGIYVAKDDGEVIHKMHDLMIVQYKNLLKQEELFIPIVKKTYSIYGTTLRHSLDEGDKFQKGDILASYDCFSDGIPTYGYNIFTAFFPFFGFNHEDAIIISESFSEKAQVVFIDKVYIPIYEYTLLKPIYQNVENSLIYFPSIGQSIEDDTVCTMVVPKDSENLPMGSDIIKNKVQHALKGMNLSQLLSLNSLESTKFAYDKIRTKVVNGTLTGLKIHALKRNPNMIDKQLQNILQKLFTIYKNFIAEIYQNLNIKFFKQHAEDLLFKYYVLGRGGERGKIDLKNACYILEFEIVKNEKTYYGDKLTNRYANKGVVSLILPDELRPVAIRSQKSIDMIYNPFAVLSRMNHGQIIEGIVSKSVMFCDEYIKNNPDDAAASIDWLNETVIRYINPDYYMNVKNLLIPKLEIDQEFRNQFVNNIRKTNLYIEAPCFAEIKIKELVKRGIEYKEDILLKKELVKYMKQKLKLNVSLPEQDIIIKNIFCSPMYIQKLYKLSSKTMNARDFGAVKAITRQPVKGRAKSGGSKLGQMELETMIANGTDRAIKELLSVKSDWSEGKDDLLKQLITTGEYHLPEDRVIKSRTKEVVDVQLKFLKE
jgi:DNA-directed RNA polymerase subunit beta